jgi:antitoxin-like ribbon-helix-helix protein
MPGKKPSLSAALREAAGQKRPIADSATTTQEIVSSDRTTKREGQKVIAGHFDPAVSKQLKLLAVEQDTNLQVMLAEAINDLFTKYRKSPIA